MTSLRGRVLLGAALWTIGLYLVFSVVLTQALFRYPMVPGFFHRVFAHVWPLTALGVVCVGLGALHVTKGLASLGLLRARLAALRSGTHPRLDGRFPAEIEPLVAELNGLLDDRDHRVAQASAKAADLAHGLKTPLAVLGVISTDAAERGHYDLATGIADEVERMQRQVDYHLARARASAARVRADARADLRSAVDGLTRTMRTVYRERALEFDVEVPPGTCVRVEPEDLDELLGVLLDNACKWARHRVAVTCEASGSHVVVRVIDDGPGIPQELREVVLTRGVRADTAAAGSGLGLAIARDLVETYGGAIALASSPRGGLSAALTLLRV